MQIQLLGELVGVEGMGGAQDPQQMGAGPVRECAVHPNIWIPTASPCRFHGVVHLMVSLIHLLLVACSAQERSSRTRYREGMGDDACWLDRTCLSCGRFLEADHVDDRSCPHCGADRSVVPAPSPSEDPDAAA